LDVEGRSISGGLRFVDRFYTDHTNAVKGWGGGGFFPAVVFFGIKCIFCSNRYARDQLQIYAFAIFFNKFLCKVQRNILGQVNIVQ
jgi:hypothetical protein